LIFLTEVGWFLDYLHLIWGLWIYEVEEDLKIMGIRNRHAVAKDRQEWREIVLEAKVHNGL
jgi:hypothetical protein